LHAFFKNVILEIVLFLYSSIEFVVLINRFFTLHLIVNDFLELAKKIRGGVNQTVIEDSVVGMRQANSGGLLIEVRGDQTQIEVVRAEVARSAGPEVDVRSLQQKALVEMRDLDQWTSSAEVLDAVVDLTSIGKEDSQYQEEVRGYTDGAGTIKLIEKIDLVRPTAGWYGELSGQAYRC